MGPALAVFRRWWLLVVVLVLALGALLLWPRGSRLLFVSPLPADAQHVLMGERIYVDRPSLAEIPDVLFATTGPEGIESAIESAVQDHGPGTSTIHLLYVHVTATRLNRSWDGLAYVAWFPKRPGLDWEVIFVDARGGDFYLNLAFGTNPATPVRNNRVGEAVPRCES